MQNRYLYFLRLALVISDFLVLNCAFFIAFNLTEYYFPDKPSDSWKYPYFMINLMWVVSTNIFKLYQFDPRDNFKRVIKATIQSTCLQILIFLLYVNFMGNDEHLWSFLFIFTALMLVSFILSRLIFSKAEPALKKTFGPKRPITLLEMNSSNRLLVPYLNSYTAHHRFEALAINSQDDLLIEDPVNLPNYNLFKDAADKGLNEVYVSLSPNDLDTAADLQKEADRFGIRLKLIYNFTKYLQGPILTNYIGNIPVLSLRKEPLEDINNIIIKRAFDIVFSLLVIIFILSWLCPIIALLIMCESKGPVLFKQMRSGRSGKKFTCYKFRSMKVNDLGDIKQACEHDDRKTKVGCILRKTSLDELPQFWNVLLGDMSVVGPRPHMLKHTEEYRNLIDNYMVRHYLKPGITGWAQVNGFRGETRTLDLMEKRIEHDIWYIENWSIKLDSEIIWKTCLHVFKGEKNAC
jgi:putative colanic acid biosynthesis UDP-glucose lipid carrier transferase